VLWGWSPRETITEVTVEGGPARYVVERESEFDAEQYDLLAALHEYEAGLGSHGLPLEETMSPDADPGNPAAKYFYRARALRDFYVDAIEQEEKQWEKNPSRARVFTAERVDL
jgi:hypothetical protein